MEDEVYKKILLVLGIALVVFFLGWVFKDTILPWVNNLGFGEIVSSNSGNKVQLTSSCGDCGSGTFNLCGRDECHKLGTCYFTKTSAFKSDLCTSCPAIKPDCIIYTDEEECKNDNCKITGCSWTGACTKI